jgi:hypothetical protein
MQNQANKQLGRPVSIQGGSAVLAVRVPLAHQQAIAAEAKEKRWSVAEVVRVAVEAHIASNCKLVGSSAGNLNELTNNTGVTA